MDHTWIKEQERLTKELVVTNSRALVLDNALRWIGGVDVSFVKDSQIACGAFVITDRKNGYSVLHSEQLVLDKVLQPYIPGFLAFRELPIILQMFNNMKQNNPHVPLPQIILVDGNGILHPRRFGLACHLGVVLSIPTIGVAKNLHHVDGLSKKSIEKVAACEVKKGFYCKYLQGESSVTLGGFVYREGHSKGVYVSCGHMVDLPLAIHLTIDASNYRIPEPIRQADILSRIATANYKSQGQH